MPSYSTNKSELLKLLKVNYLFEYQGSDLIKQSTKLFEKNPLFSIKNL